MYIKHCKKKQRSSEIRNINVKHYDGRKQLIRQRNEITSEKFSTLKRLETCGEGGNFMSETQMPHGNFMTDIVILLSFIINTFLE